MADNAPSVKPEDFTAFLKGYVPERKRAGDKDVLGGRYRILPNQPLPEFSSSYAKAYAVRDEKAPEASYYALVYEHGVPLRQKNIHAMKTFRHPALLPLLADGNVELANDRDARYAVVLARPVGQTLTELLSRNNPMPETRILNEVLRPLIEIMVAFAKLGISHNRIHPGSIYMAPGGGITLSECVGEPSGFSQDFLFEPVDRMLTSPRAKADYAPFADCYALAVLTLHLALGFAPFATTSKETLLNDILNNGAYHTLVMPWDLAPGLQDLFRGVLGEGRRARWDAATLESWIGGRRFNLVTPTLPKDSTRGFEFEDTIHYNRRSLAHAMAHHWKQAKSLLSDNRLTRWLKIHAHKQDVAEAISRVAPFGSERTAQQDDDILARVIMLLDPQGPLRFKQISVAVEAVGAMLAHAIVAERPDDMRVLVQIIDNDLTGFWVEQQRGTGDYSTLTAKLQKARQHLRMNGTGFGMERCLYDLNAGLPCLSPLLYGHPVSTISEALTALDAVARDKAVAEDFNDTHVATFLASKLDLSRELKLHEVQSVPRLASNPTLVMLKLIAQAQHRSSEHVLKGLSHWVALRLLPLLDDIHSRARAQKLRTDLRTAANKGSLEAIAEVFLGSGIFNADARDFKKASADYTARRQQIAAMQGTAGLVHHADIKGRGVAQSIAYGICIASVYVTIKSFFNL